MYDGTVSSDNQVIVIEYNLYMDFLSFLASHCIGL